MCEKETRGPNHPACAKTEPTGKSEIIGAENRTNKTE